MRRLCPSWASAMSLPWGEARAAHSMPSTFRMRAAHGQGETAGPPFLRKVCPFTVVCWEAASAGAWKPIARRRKILAGLRRWRAIVWQPLPSCRDVFECGVGECSAHVADAQPLASPRTGCRTGDPPCLDLDLRSRDAPAPAAPRWRKTHRGRCSAPLAIRDFVARGGGAELCGSGTWQWHFVQNRFSSARLRVAP